MNYRLLLLIIGFLCINCSSVKNPKQDDTLIVIENKFSEETVSWFKTKGNGTIKGVAKFKSISNDIKFGDEFRIELMPNCLYTEERLQNIYNSKTSGFVYVENGIPKFTPDPKGYHDTIKTMCNANGEFEFNNLPPGEYYLIAFMLWDKTGGGIMKRVKLTVGDIKTIKMINF